MKKLTGQQIWMITVFTMGALVISWIVMGELGWVKSIKDYSYTLKTEDIAKKPIPPEVLAQIKKVEKSAFETGVLCGSVAIQTIQKGGGKINNENLLRIAWEIRKKIEEMQGEKIYHNWDKYL